jgi:hypothetical protein
MRFVNAMDAGMALGARGTGSYHPRRGPSAIPAPAPQLKRTATQEW